ncbi:hypothetical protein [Acinetobacter baumannii]|uniref:hypothetical protein n=1 Tax=Acinetobacter baumannii TaxID=470 RepID=UPI0029496A6C|nr:hypothetical protein [Acinetobacter baumannii]MDV5263028.1 hypothetical protein [Acinetobacter baumannii]
MSEWQKELIQTSSAIALQFQRSLFTNTGRKQKLQFQPRKTYGRRLPANECEIEEMGYMKFVRKLQEQEQEIVVIKTDGEVVRGYIRAADAETISLRCYLNGDKNGRYRARVLFKHQISEFSPTKGIEDLVDELERKSKSKS